MAVFADGGKMSSKPYASSGAYINRMSDFCKNCAYEVKLKTGPSACPFNYLYWAFLIRNQDKFEKNPRMAMPYRTLEKWSSEKKEACLKEAHNFLDPVTISHTGK
jgi:deoxyribodipyrimidine photolyase-related protein